MHTVGIGRGVVSPVSERFLMLQYYDGAGHWRDLEQVRPDGHVIGRNSFGRGALNPDFLAAEHLLIASEGDHLSIEECDTINGAYLKLLPSRPVELTSGSRFQVGHHVIEFRLPEPARPVEPMASPQGEVFRSRTLAPYAFLDFIGVDNRPSLSFPLTKPEGTIIGREGETCDIALPGDDWASRLHARVAHRDDRFYLEDLQSTNGTFIRIKGRTPFHYSSLQNAGACDVLLIGALLVRVIEK